MKRNTLALALTMFAAVACSALAQEPATPPAEDTNPTQEPAKPAKIPAPYVDMVGTISNLNVIGGEGEGAGGRDFSLVFKPEGSEDTWTIISRGGTPFDAYRLGPTYLGLSSETLPEGAKARIVGIKTIDRIPAKYHAKPLPENRTATAFILWRVEGEKETPLYINNWFHPWRTDRFDRTLEGILDPAITSYFVDKDGPWWVTGWLPADTSNPDPAKRLREVVDLLQPDDLKKIAAEPFRKGVYRGYLVTDKGSPLGYRLKMTQFWRHNPQSGGYDLIIGNNEGVQKLR